MTFLAPDLGAAGPLDRLQRRLRREQAARREAEQLLESKSLELFELNRQLVSLNVELEARVAARTAELEAARRAAIAMLETDQLTGVCSRRRYGEVLDKATAEGACIGLMLIDLDDFKKVNDTFGHHVGDALLIAFAGRLRDLAAPGDLVARIGGDEFALLIPRADRAGVTAAAEAYRARLGGGGRKVLAGHSLAYRVSIGFAVAPDDGRNSPDLQRSADLALYHVKHGGGGGFAAFTPELLLSYNEQQRLEARLREAVEADDIAAWYQPIVDLRSGRVESLEVLARWQDSGGFVPPDVFIPLAERSGLIRRLSRQLLGRAMAEAKPWIERGLVQRLNFNISPLDLLHPGCAGRIGSLLEQSGFPPDRLVLEITEGVVLENLEEARATMQGLRARGVQFALDDFGSGYSNLSYVHRLPISTLKIDRSLLRDFSDHGAAQAIIRHMVALCHQLGIGAVCEGVETAPQADFLKSVRCDKAQGYLFARPAPPAAVEEMLSSF